MAVLKIRLVTEEWEYEEYEELFAAYARVQRNFSEKSLSLLHLRCPFPVGGCPGQQRCPFQHAGINFFFEFSLLSKTTAGSSTSSWEKESVEIMRARDSDEQIVAGAKSDREREKWLQLRNLSNNNKE